MAIRQQHFGRPSAAVGDRFIVPVPTKFHQMALHIPTVGIAIHCIVPTNTHQMALQFVIFRTSRQIEKREKQPHDVCFSLVFYVLN